MSISPEALAPLSTPQVCVDLDVARANIARFHAHAETLGVAVRPHIKTHKLPRVAEMQLAAGSVGITCQKVSEAEAMLDGSPAITDLLITYNILGEEKLARLAALSERVRLSVVADNPVVVEGLSRTFADRPRPLAVLVECNTGADRCGVGSPGEALDLARVIHAAPGLIFGGLMTYPPTGGVATVQSFLSQAKALIEGQGIPVPVVTSGGSPDMFLLAEAPVVTEYRPGTYVYNDRSLALRGVCRWEDCALSVLTTVVSVPAPNRAIIDAGSKVLTTDTFGTVGHGYVLDRPDLDVDQLSEEHGRLTSAGPINLRVGDRLRIVPDHACVVTNMVDAVQVFEEGRSIGPWPVVARGRVI